MPAFALRTKTWSRFGPSPDVLGDRGLINFADRWPLLIVPMNIDNAAGLNPPGKIPDVNIGADNLRITKVLSDRQKRSSTIWSADFIPEKGEGVVVLLHGVFNIHVIVD